MTGRIWTVPNQITLLRLGFLPFFLILISYERFKWALLVLVVAAGLKAAVTPLGNPDRLRFTLLLKLFCAVTVSVAAAVLPLVAVSAELELDSRNEA